MFAFSPLDVQLESASVGSQPFSAVGCVSLTLEFSRRLKAMQTRGKGQLRPRCTSCSSEFSWATARTQTVQLYPLVCGDTLCRSCLAKQARATLSSADLVPLRCCQHAVPLDYVRGVLEHAEHTYYSFLVSKTEANVLVSGKQDKVDRSGVPPVVPKDVKAALRSGGEEVEMKSPVAAAVAVMAEVQTGTNARSQVAKQAARDANGRFTVARLPPLSITTPPRPSSQAQRKPPSRITCNMCRSVLPRKQLTAQCGHDLCQKCVHARVIEQLHLDKTGAGVPVSCCSKPLPLDIVQRVIAGKELTNYAKMLVKATNPPSTQRGTKREARADAKAAPAQKKLKRQGSSSSVVLRSASKSRQDKQEEKLECSACFQSVKNAAHWFMGPCGHGYCRACLLKMTNASLENRQQVPIRCCSTEFPIDYVKRVLSRTKFAQYNRFLKEKDPHTSTLRSDRVYAELVRQNSGKQCPACGIGVVKISGCQRMYCPNGHTFCWGCGNMTCTCFQARGALQA